MDYVYDQLTLPDAALLLEYYNRHPAEYDILAAVHKVEVSERSNAAAYSPLTEEQVTGEFASLVAFSGQQPTAMPEHIKEHIRWAEEMARKLAAGGKPN